MRSFTTGTAVNLLILFVLSGVLFVLTQYLQSARGYSPLQAGLAMAPLAAAVTVASVLSGAAVAWIGARATVTTGLLLIASGTLALATAGLDTGYLHIGLCLAAIGFGTGLGTAPAITITLSEVPSDLAGVSSAVANSARQFGGALGVAVLGSILIAQYVKNLAPDVEKFPQPLIHEAEKSISAAIQFATTLDRIQAAEFLNLTVRSFVKAMHVTATIAAVTCILGAGAALALLPRGNVRRWWVTAPGALLVVALALSCGQEAVTAPLPSASGSFLLTATDTGGDYAPTFTGNGYLGVRVPPAGQGYAGGAVPAQSEVAGFYAQSAGQVQQRANVPTWSTLTFTDGGQDFSPGAGQVTGWRQQLNLQDGSITTTARWRAPNGHLTDLRYVVFTDRARPHLAIVRLELTPRWTGTATVTDLIDGAPATATTLVAKGWNAEDHQLWETVRTQGLGVVAGLASQVRVSPNVPSVTDTPVGNGADQTVGQRLVFPVTGNRTVTLTKYVGVSTSHDAAAPESAARRYAWAAAAVGFDDLLAENTAAWAALWAGRVEVLGNPTLATEVNASEFYLWSSTRAGLSWSVSPAGLSSNGYDGHIFWDAETWMYPTLLAQHPDLAAGMNDYRYQRLDAATAHAHGTGFSGARFPWESAEDGTEQIPPPTSVNSEGIYEQHITADVALAQWQYYLATGDHGWLVTRGWPVLSRAATFWASRVTPGVGGSYHINNVTGPDEENPDVNDEAYTTVAAATTLRIATRAAQIVGDTAPRSWATIADGLAPLADPSLGMHSEFAGYQGQLIKQADVTMLQYPWRYPMPAATARRDIDYYVPRSDPGGPSMDDAINAIDTAALGSAGCASFVYTQRSIAPFMRDAFDQFSETRTGGAFTFMTGIGGFLQEFLYGYSGLRWNDDAVRLDPSLTGQLDGVVLHGLAWHGRRFTVAIGASTTRVSLDAGAPLPIAVGGSTRTVTPGHPLIVPTRRPDRTPTDDLARCQAAQASSSAPGADPLAAVDGSPATGWQPQQSTVTRVSVPLAGP